MWIYLAFLSALCLGFYDVCKKVSLRDNAVLPVLLLNTLCCTLFLSPLWLASAYDILPTTSHLYVPSTTWDVQIYILLKAILVLSSWVCGYFGIKHLPLTLAAPINSMRPVLTLLGAMLIYGERLNFWQSLGVALAILSFYLLSRSGKKEGISFVKNSKVLLVILAAILGASSGLYDKYLLSSPSTGGLGIPNMVVQCYYNLYQCIIMCMLCGIIWWPLRHTQPFRWSWFIPLISIFLTLADFVYFYALSMEDALIAVVSMVRRGNVVVAFAVAAIFLHERHLRSKMLDLSLVLLSLVCLWIGTQT